MMDWFVFVALPASLVAFFALTMSYVRSSENSLTRRFEELQREMRRLEEQQIKQMGEFIDHKHVVHGKEQREQTGYIEARIKQTNEYINAKASSADLHKVAKYAEELNGEVHQLAQELGYHYVSEPARMAWRKKGDTQ